MQAIDLKIYTNYPLALMQTAQPAIDLRAFVFSNDLSNLLNPNVTAWPYSQRVSLTE